MGRILVVDDESKVLKLFEAILKPLGHEVLTESSGQMGIEAYRLHRPMATILELNLPDIKELRCSRRFVRQNPRLRFLSGPTLTRKD